MAGKCVFFALNMMGPWLSLTNTILLITLLWHRQGHAVIYLVITLPSHSFIEEALMIYNTLCLRKEIQQTCHNLYLDLPIQIQNHIGTL